MNLFYGLVFFIFLPFTEGESSYAKKDSGFGKVAEKSKNQNLIYWNKEHPLVWSYFKGKADPADKIHGAVTYAGLDLQTENFNPWSGDISFKVAAVFDQNLSWVKPDCRDERLLAHEQLHFDIAELFARRLEIKLNSMKLGKKDLKTIKKLHRQYHQKQLNMQKKYDEDTIHGIRTGRQEIWRTAVDRQLEHPDQSRPFNAPFLVLEKP